MFIHFLTCITAISFAVTLALVSLFLEFRKG